MDNITLNNICESCDKLLNEARIYSALEQLKIIARYCSNQQTISQTEELAENYHYMLSFLISGGKDENRNVVQEKTRLRAQELLRIAHRDIRLQEEHTWYSRTYWELIRQYGDKPAGELLRKWGENPMPDEQLQLQDHIFNLLWTSPMWDQKETAQWYEFISRQSDMVKIHLIGAVFLSAWEYCDKEKLSLLSLFTDTENPKLNALSITALILLNEQYPIGFTEYPQVRQLYKNNNIIKNIVVVLKEKLLMLQTIKAIKEEDNILKEFSPDTSREKMNELVNRKLIHLGEMINKGLDVNLGNRSELWHKCEFLRDNISHWWMPFEKSSPAIEGMLIDKDGKFDKQAYKILDLPSECDIDRYSMFSFIANTGFKSSIIEGLAQAMNLPGIISETENTSYINYMKMTMQNLYRIFMHSPIKGEIKNPFQRKQAYWLNPFFSENLTEENALELCREMVEADITDLPIFWIEKQSETYGTSYEMLKVKSECLYKNSKYTEAIDSLSQMLFLKEDDEWALNLIEKCYEKTNRRKLQLEIILKLIKIHPDNTDYVIRAAFTLMHMHRYEEALKYFFKLNYEEPDNTKYQEVIEECALRLKKFDLVLRYNQTILEHKEEKDKYIHYLNAGHAYFGMGNWSEALTNYKKYKASLEQWNKEENENTDPEKEFLKDYKMLEGFGIQLQDIMLMLDMMSI